MIFQVLTLLVFMLLTAVFFLLGGMAFEAESDQVCLVMTVLGVAAMVITIVLAA